MITLEFMPLHDAAADAFRSDEGKDRFDMLLRREQRKVNMMYSYLLNGTCDFFIQKTEKSEIGKSLIHTWTRSAREHKVQHTVWLCRDSERSVMSLSHEDLDSAEEMYDKAEPDDSTPVRGISLKNGECAPEEEYMMYVIEPEAYAS